MAQITPRSGRISGTSSIVQLDAWNWQDALVKENDGIHLNFPVTFSKSGSWFEPGTVQVNKEYLKQIEEISAFFDNSKAYNADTAKERNLVFEAIQGLFNGNQTLFIHSDSEKQIIDAIQFANEKGVKKMVIVGGFEAYKSADLLKKTMLVYF